MGDYHKLEAYRRARELAIECYRWTGRLPNAERYGLTSQIRRAAVSIATNVDEGAGRRTDRDFRRFLFNAIGSANELEVLVDLAADLDYVPVRVAADTVSSIETIRRMLVRLATSLTED
jgi:four helix bundle protein